MARPDGGMFSIRVVTDGIFDPQSPPFVNQDYDSSDGRSSLMNFSSEGNTPSIAANIPTGNRSLLYVGGHQRFVWAFEYTGTLDDGIRVARLHGVYDPTKKWWHIMRPIKHLARVDLATAPTLLEIENRTGFHFTPNSFPSKYISAEEYHKIYNAIP